jgi:prefoldin subunit 5
VSKVDELVARVETLEQQVAEMRQDVKQLLALMNAGRGAWRTLAVLGGATLAVAGLVAAFIKAFRP